MMKSRGSLGPYSPIITRLVPLGSVIESLEKMIIESHYGKVVSCSGLDQGYNFKIVLSFSTG